MRTPGTPHELNDRGLPSDWVVDSRLAIEKLLQAIVKAKRPARIAARTTTHRATVLLLEIDARRGRILFVPLSAGAAQTWLSDVREVVFNTDHEGIPVEFTCERPTRTMEGDQEVYSVGFPNHILRLQRRSAYRLLDPGIVCTVHDDTNQWPDLRPSVLDVSAGGIDLALPLPHRALSRDGSYPCTIVLPGTGTIGVRVRVVSVWTTPDARRYGCQFVGLPAASEVLLQRYILEEQRARGRKPRP